MKKITIEFTPEECLEYQKILRPGITKEKDAHKVKQLSRKFVDKLAEQSTLQELEKLIIK